MLLLLLLLFVVTNLHHLAHIFGLTLSIIKNIKVFLKSTLKKKISDTNFFPDTFCPVSGFAIRLQFSSTHHSGTLKSMHFHDPPCQWCLPDARFRFSKNLIFKVCRQKFFGDNMGFNFISILCSIIVWKGFSGLFDPLTHMFFIDVYIGCSFGLDSQRPLLPWFCCSLGQGDFCAKMRVMKKEEIFLMVTMLCKTELQATEYKWIESIV